LEDTWGRRLSVVPLATLKDAPAYLEWHYPQIAVQFTVNPHGQATFTVADRIVVVTDYAPSYLLD
jgi:hypothetical protein